VVTTNTNLGILLLLAPLAAVPPGEDLYPGVARVLKSLDLEDSRMVYQAIRLSAAGGLGRVAEQDVRGEPTQPLLTLMGLAADRDLVARQYVNGFREVFDEGAPALRRGVEQGVSLEEAIIGCHLHLMAYYPDTLIARKKGPSEAEEAALRAQRVLDLGWPRGAGAGWALTELDAWLRAEGHARNPGTTADLVTACLFTALREGTIQLPPSLPWSSGAVGHG
jgi:triphosphoribosyl-dephospho-CoA synthase